MPKKPTTKQRMDVAEREQAELAARLDAAESQTTNSFALYAQLVEARTQARNELRELAYRLNTYADGCEPGHKEQLQAHAGRMHRLADVHQLQLDALLPGPYEEAADA